jgi:hypothetical protein
MDAGATFVEKGGLSVIASHDRPAMTGGFCFDEHVEYPHGADGSLLGVIFDWFESVRR